MIKKHKITELKLLLELDHLFKDKKFQVIIHVCNLSQILKLFQVNKNSSNLIEFLIKYHLKSKFTNSVSIIQFFNVFKDIMLLFLHMVKQVAEKHILWGLHQAEKCLSIKLEFYQESFTTFSLRLKKIKKIINIMSKQHSYRYTTST